jgi:hypothetical protein
VEIRFFGGGRYSVKGELDREGERALSAPRKVEGIVV